MRAERHGWRSPHTGREMPVLRYGSAGPLLVYVPTSGGDEREFGIYGLPEECRPWLERGRLQVLSIDGCGPRTLFEDRLAPTERLRAYVRFERYAREELLPWACELAGTASVALGGASYGAFVAAKLWLERPGQVDLACGLGGVYTMAHRLAGCGDDAGEHTPLEIVSRLDDPGRLAKLRATRGFALFAAERDEWLWTSREFGRALRERDLPHTVEVWPAPANHHERWWRPQLGRFLRLFF